MHRLYYDLKEALINRVYVQFCAGTPFEEIMKSNHLTRYEVIAILRKKEISKKDLYEELGPRVDTEKFLIISDTHVGSEEENLDYLKDAYLFARLNGIKHVLHGGDLLQSDLPGVQRELAKPKKQLNYLLENYPEEKDITTHILLGNHDLNLFVRTFENETYLDMLKSRKDFDVLGFKKAYLKWYKILISIRHEMAGYIMPINDMRANISFAGHYHMFRQNHPIVNDFSLPTLSDEYKKSKMPKNEPGFMVLEKKGKTMLLYLYSFDREKLFPELSDIDISNRRIVNHGIVYQASMEKKLKK